MNNNYRYFYNNNNLNSNNYNNNNLNNNNYNNNNIRRHQQYMVAQNHAANNFNSPNGYWQNERQERWRDSSSFGTTNNTSRSASSMDSRSTMSEQMYRRYISMGFTSEEANNALNNSLLCNPVAIAKRRASEIVNTPQRRLSQMQQKNRRLTTTDNTSPGTTSASDTETFMHGLKGVERSWYLRYLSKGLRSQQALEKARERIRLQKSIVNSQKSIQKVIARRISSLSNASSVASSANKKNIERVSLHDPQETANSESSNSSMPPPKSNISTAIRVAIMAVSYPQYILNRGELNRLEDAIVEEISSGRVSDVKLHFEGIHYKPGMLLVDCASHNTAKWLMEITPNFTNWNGVPLYACLGNKVPSQNTVSVFLPRTGDKSPQQLLAMLMNQNEGINTSLWKVIQSRRAGRGGILLTMSIDHQSLNYLRLKDFSLWYRFGHAHVHLHKKIVMAEGIQVANSPTSEADASEIVMLEKENAELIDLTDDEDNNDSGAQDDNDGNMENVSELIHNLIHEVEEGLQDDGAVNETNNEEETCANDDADGDNENVQADADNEGVQADADNADDENATADDCNENTAQEYAENDMENANDEEIFEVEENENEINEGEMLDQEDDEVVEIHTLEDDDIEEASNELQICDEI